MKYQTNYQIEKDLVSEYDVENKDGKITIKYSKSPCWASEVRGEEIAVLQEENDEVHVCFQNDQVISLDFSDTEVLFLILLEYHRQQGLSVKHLEEKEIL